jgi:hypothetical protein
VLQNMTIGATASTTTSDPPLILTIDIGSSSHSQQVW